MRKKLTRDPNYEVDTEGNVYSVRRGGLKLSPKRNWDGYLRIQLWKNNSCEYVSIHRLIAETFIPNPENKPFVNHINGVKDDNRSDNLEWCTQRENIVHAWETGLSKSHRNCKTRSVPVNQYTLNGEFLKRYPSHKEAERQTGIAHSNIWAAVRRKGTAGGYRWGLDNEDN